MTFADISLAALMRWIDQQRATGAISDATIRRNMNLLSRFFGWAVDRGYTTTSVTWYQGTRHSFVSRNLSQGATLDGVSAAVGHSSPEVTTRYYDHFVRRSFSPKLRSGLGLAGGSQALAELIPFPKSAGVQHNAQEPATNPPAVIRRPNPRSL